MVGGAHAGADARQHDDFDFIVSQEGVTENHRQLRLPERDVLALAALCLRLVKGTDALLEAKQRLVDFGTLELSVLVITLAVLGALRASQVY